MKCNHCKGNIVKSYDNRARPRNICLQCGRDAGHVCNQRCSEIRGTGPHGHIEARLSKALKEGRANYAST